MYWTAVISYATILQHAQYVVRSYSVTADYCAATSPYVLEESRNSVAQCATVAWAYGICIIA